MPKKITMPVSALIDTYIKTTRPVKVFWSPEDADKGKNVAWEVKKGQVIGKLYSWIDLANPNYGSPTGTGLYLMFWGTEATGNKKFFVKAQNNTFDWGFVQQQLDAQKKAQMNWYEKWFDDLETQMGQYWETIKTSIYSGIGTGLFIGVGFLVVKYWVIPEMQVRRIERGVTKAIREAKKSE